MKKLYRDEDWLYKQIWLKEKTFKEVSEIANCSVGTIRKYWRKNKKLRICKSSLDCGNEVEKTSRKYRCWKCRLYDHYYVIKSAVELYQKYKRKDEKESLITNLRGQLFDTSNKQSFHTNWISGLALEQASRDEITEDHVFGRRSAAKLIILLMIDEQINNIDDFILALKCFNFIITVTKTQNQQVVKKQNSSLVISAEGYLNALGDNLFDEDTTEEISFKKVDERFDMWKDYFELEYLI